MNLLVCIVTLGFCVTQAHSNPLSKITIITHTDKQPLSHSQYVKKLKSHLEESYQEAINNSRKVADKNKKRFDKDFRESTLCRLYMCM